MHQLKSMGVRIAMDDFGTGYSSLATLQAFPFDKIKIDRSFVTDVHHDPKRAAIIRATVMMGDAMNIPVLAEGVEVAEELALLQVEKCREVQGFYFGKPMTHDQMRQFVTQGPLRRARFPSAPWQDQFSRLGTMVTTPGKNANSNRPAT